MEIRGYLIPGPKAGLGALTDVDDHGLINTQQAWWYAKLILAAGAYVVACTDQELVDRCLRGEDEAWVALSDLIARLIGGVAATRWLDAATQEDVAQEVLAELLHNQCGALRRFAGHSRLSTYLATIVLRVAACIAGPYLSCPATLG